MLTLPVRATPILVLVALLAALAAAAPGYAATFTVDSTGDAPDANTADGVCADSGGECTLRAAIEQANAGGGVNAIAFNIPGAGPHTIHVSSQLPEITTATTVDGYTQPGASANTNPPNLGTNALLRVELTGPDTCPLPGETPPCGNGIMLTAPGSTLRGLAISGFTYGVLSGTSVATSEPPHVSGNFIGTDVAGAVAAQNAWGAAVVGNVLFGGQNPADRNVVSGNGNGILMTLGGDASMPVVQGNLIGTDASGTQSLGNGAGMYIQNKTNGLVGGSTAASRNVISGNFGGILITDNASQIVIKGNYIGVDVSGMASLGNQFSGVETYDGPNQIGGTGPGEGNIIAYNGTEGVRAASTGATVRGNSIHSNGGAGISSSIAGPAITGVTAFGVSGTSCANCIVDVYSDDADEGRNYRGAVTADGSGNWSFTGPIGGPNMTATATNMSGKTSDFSAPVAVPDTDGDGYLDVRETYLGTDPGDPCGFTAGGDPASETWPPDLVESNKVDINDVLALKPVFNTDVPPTSARFDLVPGDGIDISDVLALKPVFNQSCTP